MESKLPIVDQDDAEEALSRRTFLEYLGATLSLAGLAGCNTEAASRIVPWPDAPRNLIPGVPLAYATAMELDGYAFGLLVQTREGRPIKIEGHPQHPINRGAAGPFEQASLIDLYQPHRASGVLQRGAPSSWNRFLSSFTSELGDGSGLCLLLEATASPLIGSLLGRIRERLPRARVWFHTPFVPRARWDASRELIGRAAIQENRLDRADVILSLDSDFLTRGPTWLADARAFASRRRPKPGSMRMSRLYVAECGFTSTGAKADHRIALRSSELFAFAQAIAARFIPDLARAEAPHPELVETIAGELSRARGRSLVIAGERQPKEVHALAMMLNDALGNIGNTVVYREDPILEAGEPSHDLAGLVEVLESGTVKRLMIMGGNPVYSAPADLTFRSALARAEQSAYLSIYDDETAAVCTWRLAEAHPLESWGDARSADGTVSLIQPMIKPLFGGRTRAQMLAVFTGEQEPDARSLVADAYGPKLEDHLRRGIVAESTSPTIDTKPKRIPIAAPEMRRSVEVALMPSATLHDGRFAENPWLQELPDPMARLSWGNAALIAPKTAARLGVTEMDTVRISAGDRSIEAPVRLLPGLPEESVSIALGHGRRGIGVDAFPLRTSDRPWFLTSVSIARAERSIDGPVRVQQQDSLEGREALLLERTLAEYRKKPSFAEPFDEDPPTLRSSAWKEDGHQWGMAIDLNACVGCNACVVACQAENNVPVVGKINVKKSREMHWLRLDRYYVEELGRVVHQPMLCQHCEAAPCEYVCPVNATVHSPDGLNEMVYNRCVGTRFCSNNCPYKVRRFNWFDWNRDVSDVEALHFNPDVTVRARGVMEKCTFCVQRIRRTQIVAKREGRPIGGDEIVTACQQACPSQAIVFGDVNDPRSEVSRLHRDPRTFGALNELGTRPRVRYLASIRNIREEDE